MLKMGLEGGAMNEDIIEVDNDTYSEEVAKDVIHCRLECGGGVRDEESVVPESGTEGGLVSILLADADLVEATTEVNLGKILGSTDSIEKLEDPRQGLGEDILELVEDGGEGGVKDGGLVGVVRWEQVLGMLTIKDKAIVGGVRVRVSHVKELVRGDKAWGGGTGEIGNVDGCVRGVGRAEEVGVERVCGGWVEGLGRRGVGVTTVAEVVDDDGCVGAVLVGGVDVEGVGVEVEVKDCSEEVGCGVEDKVVFGWGEEGAVVVTTVMAAEFHSIAATRSETVDMVVFMLAMDDWMDVTMRRSVVRSVAASAAEQGMQLQLTSGNHPEANGQAEQMNRAVQHLLRHYIKPNQVDWDEKLAHISSLHNSATHSTTMVSPNSLLLTFKPRLPLDFLLPENQPTAAPGTLEFAYRYENLMQQAVDNMHKAQAAMIESENKHRRPSAFQVGDRVWVKASELGQEHGISRKLMPQYFGPWEVVDIVGDNPDGPSYVIGIPGHLRTYPVFHASKLAPSKETDQFPSRRSMLAPTMDGEVDIDDIVDHREMPVLRPTGRSRPPKPKLRYRVQFRHHADPKEDKWFSREELMQTAPQKSGETDEAYQARMLLLITEAKQWSDAVAAATKKKAEDVEKARLLAIEQQRQQDEAAAKAADEERIQRRNGRMRRASFAHNGSGLAARGRECRLQQLEQRPVAAPDANSSNTSDRLNALEIDVGALKDDTQLQQTATQQQEQRICAVTANPSLALGETNPRFDDQEIFCDSTKKDLIPLFRKCELKLQLHHVSEEKHHAYLYSRSEGACQAWLDNLLSKYGVVAADLYTKINWDDLKAAWHKLFQVEPLEVKAMDKLMTF
ncbi:hypothetical protein CBR_g31326 [Chara braunii]|uniref:Integrase catalytic domain-containing protein n=1 Tax=Chara braunii TaxID=69332 RepID=A0A388LEY3_CHABU|nr:hypothetical protein CBR_g31326 [Chara braunii]|eukprot:GBG80772.1 hypothetical protein CBR_g31326 [Chara braunii]